LHPWGWDGQGVVRLTMNLLAGEAHFTPEGLAGYQALVDKAALLQE
jgi:hypothetical protein